MKIAINRSKINCLLALVIIAAFLLGSCKKVGCKDEFAVNYDSQAEKSLNSFCAYQNPEYKKYMPDFGANTATLMIDKAGIDTIYGKFWVIRSNFYLRAQFKDGNNNLVSAGEVEMTHVAGNQFMFKSLEKSVNNLYTRYSSLGGVSPNAVYVPDTMKWRAEGEVWPSFVLDNPIDSVPARSFAMSGTPSVSSDYMFQVSMVSSADSISLAIHGQRGSVVKVIAGNQTNAVFTKEELATIGKGNAVLRVLTMRYEKVDLGGKSYYFVNASRTARRVRIQP